VFPPENGEVDENILNSEEGLEENVGPHNNNSSSPGDAENKDHEKGEEKEEGGEDGHVLFALHTKGKHFLQELRDSDAQVLVALRALADL